MAVQYVGTAAALFSEKKTNPALSGAQAFEMSYYVQPDGTVVQWTDINFASDVRRYVSTDADAWVYAQTPASKLFDCRFPYVIKHPTNGYFYCFGSINFPTSMNVYAWKSADGITWVQINGNNPVLTKSSTVSSIYYNVWNVAVAVGPDGTFHLLVECAPQGVNQEGCGLGYSTATLSGDNISFDANRTATQVIPYGGNPWLGYSAAREAFVAVHGMIYDPSAVITNTTNYWHLTASYALASSNLTLAASWTTCRDKFSVGESGIHIADPGLVQLPTTKNSRLLMGYSYNQVSLYHAYADVTLAQFYDALQATGYINPDRLLTGRVATNYSGEMPTTYTKVNGETVETTTPTEVQGYGSLE